MYHGVEINGIDTLFTYGLILLDDLKISTPALKKNRVSVPGADGTLDLSYAPQGCATYEDRQITFTLFKGVADRELELLREELCNAYHGQRVTIILPNDPRHHFIGTLEVGEQSGFNSGRLPISLTVYPWKLKNRKTVVIAHADGSAEVILRNERKPAHPTVTASAAVTVTWGNHEIPVPANTSTELTDIVLAPGVNRVTVTGSATATFTYQEGSL